MPQRWRMGAIAFALLGGPIACGVPRTPPVAPAVPALRVGVSPDAPPIAFRQAGRLAGMEIDLATELAPALGRPLRFVELDWGALIPALLDGRIDVIMSGMTVTEPRQFRIAFGDPYLQSGLAALMRRRDAGRYDSPAKVLDMSARVGVVEGTTGEKFVRAHIPGASISLFGTSQDAVTELRQRRIDLFINDMPLIGWFVSENEAELAALRTPLTHDALAWGFRPDDDAFRAAANGILGRWKEDGTLSRILRRWLRLWPEPL